MPPHDLALVADSADARAYFHAHLAQKNATGGVPTVPTQANAEFVHKIAD
jgi:hypothetical protein